MGTECTYQGAMWSWLPSTLRTLRHLKDSKTNSGCRLTYKKMQKI